eukprot:29028-Pelagococcus_subviridis.AAC.3
MSFASARIRGSLSCIRPAVSTRTTSAPVRRAAFTASDATDAGSFSYPRSNSGTPSRLQCVRSCSTAPARKVSHAAIMTRTSCCKSQYATLERFVDFPTPLTPTKVITYGRPDAFAVLTSRRTSTERVGVRMRVSASSIARLTIALSDENDASFRPLSDAATDSHSRSAISSATFLFMKFVFSVSSTGARSSSSSALFPTTPRSMGEAFNTPESHPPPFFFVFFFSSAGLDVDAFIAAARERASSSSSSSSSSDDNASSSSSASTLDGAEMSTRCTSGPSVGASPPSAPSPRAEKSRSFALPFVSAHTRFSFGRFAFFFPPPPPPSPSSPPVAPERFPLLPGCDPPPFFDLSLPWIFDMSNAPFGTSSSSFFPALVDDSPSASLALALVAAFPEASFRFAAFFAASKAFGAALGARRDAAAASLSRIIASNGPTNASLYPAAPRPGPRTSAGRPPPPPPSPPPRYGPSGAQNASLVRARRSSTCVRRKMRWCTATNTSASSLCVVHLIVSEAPPAACANSSAPPLSSRRHSRTSASIGSPAPAPAPRVAEPEPEPPPRVPDPVRSQAKSTTPPLVKMRTASSMTPG